MTRLSDVAAGMTAIRNELNALLAEADGEPKSPGIGAGDVTGGRDAALIKSPPPARHNPTDPEAPGAEG